MRSLTASDWSAESYSKSPWKYANPCIKCTRSRDDSSGSLGSLGDIFASLGRRKSRSGGHSRSGSTSNAPWDDGGRSRQRDDTLRRRRRSASGGALSRSISNASLSIEEAILDLLQHIEVLEDDSLVHKLTSYWDEATVGVRVAIYPMDQADA